MTEEHIEKEAAEVEKLVMEIISGHGLGLIQEAHIAMDYLLESGDATSDARMPVSRLAVRVHGVMPAMGDPRFCSHDYMDGIVNATCGEVDLEKLMALDDEAFARSLVWLACYKRETYEDRPHGQGPLEHGIWK